MLVKFWILKTSSLFWYLFQFICLLSYSFLQMFRILDIPLITNLISRGAHLVVFFHCYRVTFCSSLIVPECLLLWVLEYSCGSRRIWVIVYFFTVQVCRFTVLHPLTCRDSFTSMRPFILGNTCRDGSCFCLHREELSSQSNPWTHVWDFSPSLKRKTCLSGCLRNITVDTMTFQPVQYH